MSQKSKEILVNLGATGLGLSMFFLLNLGETLDGTYTNLLDFLRISLAALGAAFIVSYFKPNLSPFFFTLFVIPLSLLAWWTLQSLLVFDQVGQTLSSVLLAILIAPLALLTYWPEFLAAAFTIYLAKMGLHKILPDRS